jgi:hypothetical protein
VANSLYVLPNPPPAGTTFPFSIADDMLGIVDGLTTATVKQTDPDSGATVQTATGVTILKRNTGVVSMAVGDGEGAYVNCSHIRIWASTCPFVPKYRDLLTDQEGITWMVGQRVDMESFNGFYVFSDCTQLKTQA